MRFIRAFEFRVLRENRRVVAGDEDRKEELDGFHDVLSDISWCRETAKVRKFIADAYLRGAAVGSAERAELEGSTAAFCKRRMRDRWNRIIVRRVGKTRAHTLKIKARVRARGARGQDSGREGAESGAESRASVQEWFTQGRAAIAQKKSRTQMQWMLQLAGDWHASEETAVPHPEPHMMRVMLVSNLAVEQRFANGTSRES